MHTDKAIAGLEAQPIREAVAGMPRGELRDTFNKAYYAHRELGSDGEQCRAGVLAVIDAAIESAGVAVRG